jgi:threonine synthase
VHALAIEGTFDDAQRILKEAFGDHAFAREHALSAINSINLARVLAQCVYYLYAWMKLAPGDRARLEFVVPTGNFGNVLAGWLLSRMGVPMSRFKVATNQNDILHRFFETGVYRVDKVQPSHAPSMDIQVASNFERFLYYALGEDPVRVVAAMADLKKTGEWKFADFKPGAFSSSRADDKDIVRIIREVHKRFDYVVDPHTACAFQQLDPARVSVVLATAHPAKFPEVIKEATGTDATHPSLEALKDRPIVKHRLKADVAEVKAFIAKRGVGRGGGGL